MIIQAVLFSKKYIQGTQQVELEFTITGGNIYHRKGPIGHIKLMHSMKAADHMQVGRIYQVGFGSPRVDEKATDIELINLSCVHMLGEPDYCCNLPDRGPEQENCFDCHLFQPREVEDNEALSDQQSVKH